jgi:hypothetical protein
MTPNGVMSQCSSFSDRAPAVSSSPLGSSSALRHLLVFVVRLDA